MSDGANNNNETSRKGSGSNANANANANDCAESLRISRKGSGTPLTFESFENLLTLSSTKRNTSDKNRCEALRKAKMTYMQHA